MNGELLYSHDPHRFRKYWVAFYLIVFFIIFGGVYAVADKIRTHNLPVGAIELKVPYTKFLVGENVPFSVTNNFNSAVYISNQCPSEPLNVYKKVGVKWQRIHDTAPIKSCPNEQRQIEIPPHTTIHSSFKPWKHLFAKPGDYRVVAYVEFYNSLPYQDFQIVAKPKINKPKPAPTQAATPTSAPQQTTTEPNEPKEHESGGEHESDDGQQDQNEPPEENDD